VEDLTILYYSSNRESPEFEGRVIKNLLENCGDLPIISITHQPMDLGNNICVGDVGVSGFNMFRQVQLGLKKVETEFVISAEADCLYPPDYFKFVPEKNDVCYRNSNLYVMPDCRDFFFLKKEGATHSQVIGTRYYLDRLNELFGDAPMWSPEEKNFPRERHGDVDVFNQIEYYKTENPVIQIKTHKGMRYYTHSERIPIPSLPYWGSGKDLRRYYLHGK